MTVIDDMKYYNAMAMKNKKNIVCPFYHDNEGLHLLFNDDKESWNDKCKRYCHFYCNLYKNKNVKCSLLFNKNVDCTDLSAQDLKAISKYL
jgi:hypothetical protein